jgi:hypothetical protein
MIDGSGGRGTKHDQERGEGLGFWRVPNVSRAVTVSQNGRIRCLPKPYTGVTGLCRRPKVTTNARWNEYPLRKFYLRFRISSKYLDT